MAINPAWVGVGLQALGMMRGGNNPNFSVKAAIRGEQQPWQLQQQREQDIQREFAQMGIRWRVEDAEAAGVHPLFALGAQPAQYTPVHYNPPQASGRHGADLAAMGQNIARAVAAQETADERALRAATLRGAEAAAERDEAHAMYYWSLIGRGAQENNQANPMPSGVVAESSAVRVDGRGTQLEAHPLYEDVVELKPDEMVSRDPYFGGQSAGRDHPSMRQFEFPGGFRMLLPATSGGGIPEEIDAGMLPFVLGANLERYGWRWMIDAMGYFSGQSPDSRRERGTLEGVLRRYFGGRQNVQGTIRRD